MKVLIDFYRRFLHMPNIPAVLAVSFDSLNPSTGKTISNNIKAVRHLRANVYDSN